MPRRGRAGARPDKTGFGRAALAVSERLYFRKGERRMVRLKRGISFLLALTICFGFMLPYAGRISASEKEEDRTVCLALSEHGRMRFADSKEEANEQTRVYQEGEIGRAHV